jgi:peptidoglycan/xylan/chitin deacetylase (PgdA/CDA1 family)
MLPVFVYHQIADVSAEHDPRQLATPPAVFARQMAYLYEQGYRSIDLAEAVTRQQAGQSLPRRAFAITFDDGYRDLFTTARYILSRYGFTATVFLVTNQMGQICDWDGQRGPLAAPLLTWDEARALTNEGFAFGAHTENHRRLPDLSPNEARAEITQSRQAIQAALGRPARLFSYPYGASTPAIQRMTAEAGYSAAYGVDRGEWTSYNRWRIECKPTESLSTLLWKARGLPYHFFRFREENPVGTSMRRVWRRVRHLPTSPPTQP